MSEEPPVKEPTLAKWLAAENRQPSEAYARVTQFDLGTDDLPVERYTSRAFHELEMKRMWPRAWQMACHESNIPDPGDYTTYEIGNRSWIISRQKDGSIRAFVNACLHRGMQLVAGSGKLPALVCPFHGWSWNMDGTNRGVTEKWDFPQLRDRDLCLPQAKVATWGGFVFINPDPGAPPFEDYIGDLDDHFASDPLENRKVAAHVARVTPANWKVAMEAFIESYHVSPTHPQAVPVSEYAETQYDIYNDNVSRLATISIAPVSDAMKALSEQEFADLGARSTGREPIQLKPGETYRQALADERRRQVGAAFGKPVDHLTDCEMLDAVEYFLFPNFMPWHGYGLQIAYRFRPNGDDHATCIMEIYVLTPRNLSEPCPRAPETEWIPEGGIFGDSPGLGRVGPIFDQDWVNIIGVWKGLQSTVKRGLWLGKYQEARIRHYHKRIDDFIALGDPE
ncbi:MAG: aromatic ring-hydroxylating dioxygenase subunit alpha [Novosphingobium sp.]|nr:aromatic ring-hydroxylating dioxygenase subunit alpha [Novosphingobium sp.]